MTTVGASDTVVESTVESTVVSRVGSMVGSRVTASVLLTPAGSSVGVAFMFPPGAGVGAGVSELTDSPCVGLTVPGEVTPDSVAA